MEQNIKRRIFDIIERSSDNDKASRAYDIMIYVAVFVGILPLTMKVENHYTRIIDMFTSLIFLMDYLIRLFTADYKMGVKSKIAYIAYIVSPLAIIDLLAIVPIIGFFFPEKVFIKVFRIFRVARIFKLIRYSKTMVSITNVIRRVKRPLMAVLVLALVYICTVALVMFQVEPDLFDNFFEAIYFATVSLTTIGYGDIYPATTFGQAVSVLSALVGVAVIALPSGIITAAYMEEITKVKGAHEL